MRMSVYTDISGEVKLNLKCFLKYLNVTYYILIQIKHVYAFFL